jgi:glycosyltransferase involved in cell wall biosynthesis
VLLLRRQPLGGMASYTEAMVSAFPRIGITATIQEATDWIPNETDLAASRKVSKRLRVIGQDFDIVHAIGYRSAWACSDAFGTREAWVYTAYDMPKTTHKLLIDKLNEAQMGYAASHAIKNKLMDAGIMDIVVRHPGYRKNLTTYMEKSQAKAALDIPTEAPVVGGLGRLVTEHGYDALVGAMERVWSTVPEAHLVVAGTGPTSDHLKAMAEDLPRPSQVHFPGFIRNPADFYRALDLFVVPAWRAGFSMGAIEAMSCSVPCLVRAVDGLKEIVQQDYSGLTFETDEELGLRIQESLQMPLMLHSVGNAGSIRAETMFSIDAHVEALATSYRNILE